MNIKYAGPRPTMSQHGIEFKEGKEDKYVYLMIGIQILKAIDKDYKEHSSYSYDVDTKRVDDTIMLDTMKSYEANIDNEVEIEISKYQEHIEDEIIQIQNSKILKDIEKEIWINNIKIMTNYRLQRAVNKIYYVHCVNNIRDIIKREEIKELETPFYEKYWHILQTIQGSLETGRDSKHTKLKVFETKDHKMMAKLTIGD